MAGCRWRWCSRWWHDGDGAVAQAASLSSQASVWPLVGHGLPCSATGMKRPQGRYGRRRRVWLEGPPVRPGPRRGPARLEQTRPEVPRTPSAAQACPGGELDLARIPAGQGRGSLVVHGKGRWRRAAIVRLATCRSAGCGAAEGAVTPSPAQLHRYRTTTPVKNPQRLGHGSEVPALPAQPPGELSSTTRGHEQRSAGRAPRGSPPEMPPTPGTSPRSSFVVVVCESVHQRVWYIARPARPW